MDPAIVIVHGSWHTPAHYTLLISALKTHGFHHVFCPRLPSAVDKLPFPPTANLAHDTRTIHNQITSLADAGHPILVLMHSYGGVVGSNALTDLLWHQRQALGKSGGVVHLIYTAAFVIPAATSLSTPFEGGKIPWLEEDPATGNLTMLDPRKSHYGDIKDDKEAQKWLDLCVLCPGSVIKDETTSDPLRFVGKGLDATYLVCRRDYRLKTEVQEGMASLLGDEREVVYCDAGHGPMVSFSERVAEVVMRAWMKSKKRLESESS